MAIEKVVVDAIACSENSVVAIGIFRRDGLEDNGGLSGVERFNIEDGPATPELEAVPDYYGTGVVIDGRGLILTNYHIFKKHVVEGKLKDVRIFVRAAGRPIWAEVKVKAADPYSDLAVLEVDIAKAGELKLQPIRLGDAATLRKGQFVITLGNPYAIARDGEVSAGWGIVSNTRRQAPPREGKAPPHSRPSMHHFGTLLQTDAKLNLGTSGGPLLNLQGEMVGLITSMAALAGYEQSAGYAIPVDDTFRRVVKLLSQGREVEYGFLGVRPRDLGHAERRKGYRGVRIDGVVEGTPAWGVLQHQDVVTHIDGQPIYTVSDFMLAVGRQPAGGQVKLDVLRVDRPVTLQVTLTKNNVIGERIASSPRAAWRGLRVEYPAALRALDYPEPIPSGCVIVTDVEPSSPAAAAGLQAGMRIERVDDERVETPAEFLEATAEKNGFVRLQLSTSTAEPSELVVQPEGGGVTP